MFACPALPALSGVTFEDMNFEHAVVIGGVQSTDTFSGDGQV